MVRARRAEAWEHTSWLLALIANCHRDPKKRPAPFEPADYNPLAEKKRKASGGAAINVAELKNLNWKGRA